MKCQQCGAEVAAASAFCATCGTKLTGATAAGAAAARPVAASAPAAPKGPIKPSAARTVDPEDPEEMLWEGRFSKLAMIDSWLMAGVLSIVVVVAGLLLQFEGRGWMWALIGVAAVWLALLLKLLYQQLAVRYALTSQRLIHERGILWRQTDRIEAIDIDDVSITQGPIGRMVGVGNVKVVSSDQSTPLFFLLGIEDVRTVATMIDDVRRKERRKRGVHIESV